MKLEFSKFDIDSFDKSEDWKANCVFILEDGVFIEGVICCHDGKLWFYYKDIICDEGYEFNSLEISSPKFYMFKD